jgi:hypothetical protein
MARFDDSNLAPIPGRGQTIGNFARSIIQETLIRLRVGMPGTVTAWHAPVPGTSPALVDVQPAFIFSIALNTPDELPDGYTLSEHGGALYAQKALPEIKSCPILYPSGGGAMLRGPLKVGSEGYIHIADRSLDAWLSEGGPVDPVLVQYHDLSDAVFEPGLRSAATAQDVPTDRTTLGPEDDTAGLDFALADKSITLRTEGPQLTLEAAATILLGDGATLGVARLSDPVDPSAAMIAWASMIETAITGAGGVIPPGTNFALTVQNLFASISGASTIVKSK